MIARTRLLFALVAASCLLQPASAAEKGATKDEIVRQWNQATDLSKKGKHADAVALFEKLRPGAETIYGRDSLDMAKVLHWLGYSYARTSQPAKAEAVYLRSLQIREAKLTKDHADVIALLNDLASVYRAMPGQNAKAETQYLRVLNLLEAKHGMDHIDLAAAVTNLAATYRAMGQYAKAEPYYLRGVEIREAKLAKDHPLTGQSLNLLAANYTFMKQFAKAEPIYMKALAIYDANRPKDELGLAVVLNNLGLATSALGQHAKAESFYLRSLSIREIKLAKDHPDVIAVLNELGSVYRAMPGQNAKAETQYQRVLQILQDKHGRDHLQLVPTLNSLGSLYRAMDQKAKAEAHYLRSLHINEAHGKEVTIPLTNLASLYRSMNEFAKAEPLLQRHLDSLEAKHGRDDVRLVYYLNELASLHRATFQYAKAVPLYQRSLRINELKNGAAHATVAFACTNLADVYQDMGDSTRAEPLYRRNLEIRESGTNLAQVATALDRMGHLYNGKFDYAQAESFYVRSLETRERLGKNDALVAISHNNLASLYGTMGRFAEAEQHATRALEIRDTDGFKDQFALAQSLNTLANLYVNMAQYHKAEPLYERALRIREDKQGREHAEVATAVSNLAYLYGEMGQYSKAEPLYQRGLEIREARFGKDHPVVATSLNSLAGMYRVMGQFAKAETHCRRGLEIREAKLGADHPIVAVSLDNLAMLHVARREYDKAEPLYLRSLQIREAKFGKGHASTAFTLNGLANLYLGMRQYAKAAPICERTLQLRQAHYGKTHPHVAHALWTQATIAWGQQDHDRAMELLQQAIEIFRVRLPKHNPTTSHAMTRYASYLNQTDRSAEAVRTMEQSLRGLRIHAAQVLPILPESEQLSFMVNSFERDFITAASMGLNPKLSVDNRMLTAGWVLNGKSVIHQSLAERYLLARDNQSAAAKRVLADLEEVRRQLARLNQQETNPKEEASFRKEIESLQKKEKTLESRLHAAGAVQRQDPWVEIDELRRKLAANVAYVDFLRFAPTESSAPKGTPRKKQAPVYVAWISTRDKDTAVINLGSAAKIDEAIQAALKELQQGYERIKSDGEADAEKLARAKMADVAKLVLDPLMPHLAAYPQWILGPDSNLWLIPWACLPLGDEKYVIEKHTLRYVTSGRDLVLNPLQLDQRGSAPVIFADPDFDLQPNQVVKADANQNLRALRHFGKVTALPGTAVEADAITPALMKFAKAAPRRFLEGEATVTAFQKLKGPRVLVLSTHGFFLPDQKVPEHLRSGSDDNQTRAAAPGYENPLLRSGLLLAGYNHFAKGRTGQDTGVLTGLEIVGTDLRGTELVVLSACETGLGDIHNGEGVAGLRKAFHLAGAQTVVASLWKISDRETALLMKSFFENMAAGQNKVDALRDAQLTMLRERRVNNAAAHPFFWGAFTLTGR